MDPFYGGLNGQSFTIKKIFPNKQELDKDLAQIWNSPVSVGEFVLVSYGLPNEGKYQENKEADIGSGGKTYNSTLWQKVYAEDNKGLGYKLLTSLTGNTPIINVAKTIQDAGEQVSLVYDNSDVDNPKITFNLPAHYIWSHDVSTTTPLNGAEVSVTTSGDYKEQLLLKLKVPNAWDIDVDTRTLIAPGASPDVSLVDDGSDTTKTFHFTIPKAQLFTLTRIADEDGNPIDVGADQGIVFTELDPTASNSDDKVIDTRNFIYQLPKSWKLVMDYDHINATEDPYIVSATGVNTGNPIDTKTWTIRLPKAWNLELQRQLQNAETGPSITTAAGINSSSGSDGLIDTKTWTLNLPKAWDLNVDYEEVDPNQDIDLTVETTRGETTDTRTWTFHLPRPWNIDIQKGETLGPKVDPSISKDSDTNDTKRFLANLPRAVYFYYGTLLGERTNTTYTLIDNNFSDYKVGDYYINERTGFIYEITEKTTDTTCEFTYRACIQSPLPTVVYHSIDPYDENGNPVTPRVERNFTNSEETAWQLDFYIPNFPIVEHDFKFVGVDEEGEVDLQVSDTNKLKFDFTIPRGSQIYSGTEISESNHSNAITIDGKIIEVKSGDIYVNTDSGKIYTWDKAKNMWKIAEGSLKGPAGDPINIIAKYSVETSETDTANWDSDSDYQSLKMWVEQQYKNDFGADALPADNEVIDVQWIRTIEGSQSQQFFWVHYLTGDTTTPPEKVGWHVDLLTGNVGSIFMSSYGSSSNQGYTADYINSLIGGVLDITDADRQTYSEKTFDSIWGWGTWDSNGTLFDSAGNKKQFIIPAGTEYYSSKELTIENRIGIIANHVYANQVDATTGSIDIDGVTYYVKREDMVSGHLYDDSNTYSAKEIDYLMAWGRFPTMVKG